MTPMKFSERARLLREKAQTARHQLAKRRARDGRTSDLSDLEAANEKAILIDKLVLMAICLIENGFGDGVKILGEMPRR